MEDDDMPKQPLTLVGDPEIQSGGTIVPISPPIAEAALPRSHVVHAQVLYNEMRTKLTNYEQGLTLLKNEADNIQARYDADMADVQRRINDHVLCRSMATSSVETYEHAEGT